MTGAEFIEAAAKYQGNECIEWPLSRSGYRNRYGWARFHGRAGPAHRFVCELAHGVHPPEKPEAAHLCGNSFCLTPRHLQWKSRRDNEADKLLHGTVARGSRHGKSKLSESQVLAIKREFPRKSISQIAREFGVNSGTISNIKSGTTWAWLR